ncbi:MAG TPA: FtsK/SpoIIIE domain-containing protein [Vampirovibrionales bacterium]
MMITINTLPAASQFRLLRLIFTAIGGVGLPIASLCLEGRGKLSEDFRLMNEAAEQDCHDAILRGHVRQFDPDVVLNPQPAIALPQGTDELSRIAGTIINSLATFDKKPITLEFVGGKVGCSANKLIFEPQTIKDGQEAVKKEEVIHAACKLTRHQSAIMYIDQGQLIVEVPRKDRQFLRFEMTPETRTDMPRFRLGHEAIDGTPIEHIFTPEGESPSYLVSGGSGSGKTVGVNSALMSGMMRYSPKQLQLVVVDCKGGQYKWLQGSPWLRGKICETPAAGKQALDEILAEGERRMELFPTLDTRDIQGYNEAAKATGKDPLPVIVFLIDELAEWMAKLKCDPAAECKPEDIQVRLSRVAQLLRSAGIALAIGTQKPIVKDEGSKFPVISSLLGGNLMFRQAFKVNNPMESSVALGGFLNPNASQLLGKGDFLWSRPDGTLTRGQTLFIPDNNNKELDRLHAIAADYHQPGWRSKSQVRSVPAPKEIIGEYLESLESAFKLPAHKQEPATAPKVANLDRRLWQAIAALKLHPSQPAKTKIISIVWGVSDGGGNFDRSNPNSPLSHYERLLAENREDFIILLIKLGASPEGIAKAAFDAKSADLAEAIAQVKLVSQDNHFGWPYFRLEAEEPQDYNKRYSPAWNQTTAAVKATTHNRCSLCENEASQTHHAYYKSWWGLVPNSEKYMAGVALFPLCEAHHKPSGHEIKQSCAHHPKNWVQRGVWDSTNSLEFFAALLQGWLKKQ